MADPMLPVAILNNHLKVFGGGERATYALANVLATLGHRVDVLTLEQQVPSAREIEAFFGPGHDGFRVVGLGQEGAADGEEGDRALVEHLSRYAVFVNHSAGSTVPNPCPLGVYSVMFPFQAPGPWLATYGHLVCNSRYTERHTRRRWGMSLPTTVVYPAADLRGVPAETQADRRGILAVGRFNWRGHTKNQDHLVEAFVAIATALPDAWELVLLGKVNPDRHTLEQLAALQWRCRRLPVRFVLNATEAEKQAELGRAAILWHGTGLGCDETEHAERMEHFGIAIVEAMAAGAVPLCYHVGGPREIVDHGETGFLYRDADELGRLTVALASQPRLLRNMSALARVRARRFDRAAFDGAVAAFFSSIIAT